MNNPLLVCRACKQDIGKVDMDKIRQPMNGSMFLPKTDGHAKPFRNDANFKNMKCKICHKRVAFFPDKLIVRSDKHSNYRDLEIAEQVQEVDKMKCGLCGEAFDTGHELEEHLLGYCKRPDEKKETGCPHCGRDDFANESRLKAHITMKHKKVDKCTPFMV